jgi:hypothetical protein
MMRLCIIGNSHIAALKNALDGAETKPAASVETVFFGSHSNSLRQVRAADGKFVTDDAAVRRALAMTTGRADPELAVADFDCFVLHALFNPNWMPLHTLWLSQHCLATDAVVSSGLVAAFVAENYRNSLLAHMLGVIRSMTDVPIVVSLQPYLSDAIRNDPVQGVPYVGMESLADYRGPTFADALAAVIKADAEKQSYVFLPQPAETVVDRFFTAHEYCAGSVRLSAAMDIEHPADDFAHMNRQYGALVMRDIYQRINAM